MNDTISDRRRRHHRRRLRLAATRGAAAAARPATCRRGAGWLLLGVILTIGGRLRRLDVRPRRPQLGLVLGHLPGAVQPVGLRYHRLRLPPARLPELGGDAAKVQGRRRRRHQGRHRQRRPRRPRRGSERRRGRPQGQGDRVLRRPRGGGELLRPEVQKTNPVTLYRWGSMLDEDYLQFAGGKTFTEAGAREPGADDEGDARCRRRRPTFPEEYWRGVAQPRHEGRGRGAGRRGPQAAREAGRPQRQAGPATACCAAPTSATRCWPCSTAGQQQDPGRGRLHRRPQHPGLPGGVLPSSSAGQTAGMPLFVVGVGEDRPQMQIDIVDSACRPRSSPTTASAASSK